jgi:hypothetical protein
MKPLFEALVTVGLLAGVVQPLVAAEHDPVSVEAAACPECGTVRVVREISRSRPMPRVGTATDPRVSLGYVTGPGSTLPVGPMISKRWGASADGGVSVGALGSKAMIDQYSDVTYEVIVRLDAGGYTRVEGDGLYDLRVGDRVRLVNGQLELVP